MNSPGADVPLNGDSAKYEAIRTLRREGRRVCERLDRDLEVRKGLTRQAFRLARAEMKLSHRPEACSARIARSSSAEKSAPSSEQAAGAAGSADAGTAGSTDAGAAGSTDIAQKSGADSSVDA